MSELRVASDVEPSVWNEALRACNGTIFHTAEWAAYARLEQPGARAEFYTMLDDSGSVAGMALGFHSASSRKLAASVTGHCWLDALPAVRDEQPSTRSRMLRLIEDHARRTGDVTFLVGSFASPASEAVLGPLGFSVARRLEFELDLTPDEKTLWDGMEYKRRKNIKKAMKCAVHVRELPIREGVGHLRRLQAASFERVTARGGPSLIERNSDDGDPITALPSPGLGRIVGGFVDDTCVTASFFTTFNGLAYHTLSGHDGKALETQAPTLVLWEMFLRFRGEGITRLNFGGCSIGALDEASPEHGVYAYKKAFGGDRLDCATGDKILRPTVHRLTSLLRGAAR